MSSEPRGERETRMMPRVGRTPQLRSTHAWQRAPPSSSGSQRTCTSHGRQHTSQSWTNEPAVSRSIHSGSVSPHHGQVTSTSSPMRLRPYPSPLRRNSGSTDGSRPMNAT